VWTVGLDKRRPGELYIDARYSDQRYTPNGAGMRAILRLYPRAWRERYGDELLALLAERPATLGDVVDIVGGALDARLHPQIAAVVEPARQDNPMRPRALGALAAIGGIAWIVAIGSFFVLTTAGGDRQETVGLISLGVGMASIGLALAQLGTRRGSRTSAWTGKVLALIALGLAGTTIMPWPLIGIGAVGFPPLMLAGAIRGALNRTLPAWFVALPVVTLASVLGFSGLLGEAGVWALALVGAAALVLAGLAIRGSGDVARARPV
jgi:hypothetical protein